MSPFASLDTARYALPEELCARLLTPALVVHLDLVRANLARVLELCGGAQRWRPHVKSAKIPRVFAELARAGLRHFKCATTREAAELLRALAAEGIADPDVLLAQPLIGPALTRLATLAREQPEARLSVLCEDPAQVEVIPVELGVFVDLDPGMHRTGLDLGERAAIAAIARRAGARFRGLHFYDGHMHMADLAERERAVHAGLERLLALAAALAREGLAPPELVTSGTPAFRHALSCGPLQAAHARGELLHRVSPGTVVYHDLRSEEENPGLRLAPAALVLTRVLSHPRPGHFTCDAGSKSLAAEAGDPAAFVLGHPRWTPLAPSEEHLPVRVEDGERPPRGATLLLVPRHVCPTVNLAEEAVLLDGGRFAGIAPVSARAHELLCEVEES